MYELTCVKKSKCSNHRAQNNGNIHRKHLDSTGKGACACARHGAFVPHCVVDFQKGERYIRHYVNDDVIDRMIGKPIWTTQSARP